MKTLIPIILSFYFFFSHASNDKAKIVEITLSYLNISNLCTTKHPDLIHPLLLAKIKYDEKLMIRFSQTVIYQSPDFWKDHETFNQQNFKKLQKEIEQATNRYTQLLALLKTQKREISKIISRLRGAGLINVDRIMAIPDNHAVIATPQPQPQPQQINIVYCDQNYYYLYQLCAECYL